MADEISLSTSFTVNNGIDRDSQTFSNTFDQTGKNSIDYTLTATDASWIGLNRGNIGNLGLLVIRNLSSTSGDNVTISCDGGTTGHFQLKPGQWLMSFLHPATDISLIKLKADVGKTVLVRVWIKEE